MRLFLKEIRKWPESRIEALVELFGIQKEDTTEDLISMILEYLRDNLPENQISLKPDISRYPPRYIFLRFLEKSVYFPISGKEDLLFEYALPFIIGIGNISLISKCLKRDKSNVLDLRTSSNEDRLYHLFLTSHKSKLIENAILSTGEISDIPFSKALKNFDKTLSEILSEESVFEIFPKLNELIKLIKLMVKKNTVSSDIIIADQEYNEKIYSLWYLLISEHKIQSRVLYDLLDIYQMYTSINFKIGILVLALMIVVFEIQESEDPENEIQKDYTNLDNRFVFPVKRDYSTLDIAENYYFLRRFGRGK